MEIFTRNFLLEHEAEMERVFSNNADVDDMFTDLKPPSVDALRNYITMDKAQYRRVFNHEKLSAFRALYQPLEEFAEGTIADLCIEYDEDTAKGEISLKYQALDSTMIVLWGTAPRKLNKKNHRDGSPSL